MSRPITSPYRRGGLVLLLSLIAWMTALPASGGEVEGLYLLSRQPAAERLLGGSGAGEGGISLRYHDEVRLLADLSAAAAEDLRARGLSPELISAGPSGRGFHLLAPDLGGRWAASPASLPGAMEAGGLWLVPADTVLTEEQAPAGVSFSLLPRGPLPLGATAVTDLVFDHTAGPQVATFLCQLSESTLAAYNQRLEDFETRYTFTDSVLAAAAWIGERFEEFGLTEVTLDTFYINSYPVDRLCVNVVAVKPGVGHPGRQVVVGGHYDSLVQLGHPREYAPGADDNGSATAAVLELARVLAPMPLDYTLIFAAFAAEEQGLRGSWHYAEEAYHRGDDIRLMINMDMIGFLGDDVWNVNIFTNGASQTYADIMADMAATYTPLTPLISSASSNSDHWPFMQYGYHALCGHEGVFNDCWHRQCDTTDRLTSSYHLEVVRTVAATILSVADPEIMAAVAGADPRQMSLSQPPLEVYPLPGTGPFLLRHGSVELGASEVSFFDARGRCVHARELTPEEIQAGEFHWDGRGTDGEQVPAGVYWAQVKGPAETATARVVVVR